MGVKGCDNRVMELATILPEASQSLRDSVEQIAADPDNAVRHVREAIYRLDIVDELICDLKDQLFPGHVPVSRGPGQNS